MLTQSKRRATRLAVGLGLALCALGTAVITTAQVALLDPVSHPKFVNPLPRPAKLDLTNGGRFPMDMKEVVQSYGLVDPAGVPLLTTVWGYGQPDNVVGGIPVSSPGPTLVAQEDVPVRIMWRNKLPRYNAPGGPAGTHLLPVDATLHMARPVKGVPTVVHLHGGHTESASDGLPEAWFTQAFQERGEHFVKRRYVYHNDQEAATLWYHDHALGITRLNVYAGMAGFYFLRDDNENALTNGNVIPGGEYEAEIVIQDRLFDAAGQLYFPSTGPDIAPGFPAPPPGPSAIAEFFGDFMLVNGAVWPNLNVEPRKYRLRMLNGSDSRFYILEFHDADMGGLAQEFFQIGTDNGLLETPVPLTRLLIAPGERADLVVDFAGLTEVYMKNFGPDAPFKGFNPDGTVADGAGGVEPAADPMTTGQVMKFTVNLAMDSGVPDASVGMGTSLRAPIAPLTGAVTTRNLALFEGLDEYGRLQPLLGTIAAGSQAWFEPITENPMINDVEIWEVYNATEDAHPIHLHLVSFQILNRESFNGAVAEKPQAQHSGAFGVGGQLTITGLGGDVRGPEPNEAGWKDTAVMLPGEVTRVIARFDRGGRYVWHCHILSHEDHEMMRPFYVGPMDVAMASAKVADTGPGNLSQGETLPETSGQKTPASYALGQNYPNPFNPATNIRFQLPAEGHTDITVYDVKGRVVKKLTNRSYGAGIHTVAWDGRDNAGNSLASGIYFYRLTSGSFIETKRMVLVR